MKRENHLDFLTNRKNKYSIRKFSVGAASILVGSMIFISPQVDADETTDDAVTEEEATVEEEPQSAEDEVTQTEEETEVEEDETEDTTGPEILGVEVYEGASNEGTEDETQFIAIDVTASDESEVAAVEGEFREVGNPENSQLTSLPTVEQDANGNYVGTAGIAPEPGVTYELVNVRVTDVYGNVTESTDYTQQITAGEGTDVPDEEEEADDYQSIDEAYLSFRMSGYAGEQPDIYGNTAEGGTITVVLPDGEEYVFEPDETGNVDEVFPIALDDNTEITVIFTDSEGGTYQETLLYTSTPTEEDPEEEDDPEEDDQPEDGEETPGEDDQSDEGEDDNSDDDGQDGDDGQDDSDDSDDSQDGDDSEDGQDDEETDDEETPDSEEPPLSESSNFSANLSGYEGDGYLTIDGSAPKNTVVTLALPDGSTEEVTVDDSGNFSVEIDEYPVGSEVNVHFLFEDDSEFEDDLEIKYLGDDEEEDSDDGQDGDDSDDGQNDSEGSDDGQDGDDSDDGQDDSEGSDDGQDGDDSEDLDEDEAIYSYLEDYGSGITVHSNSGELLNLTLSVEVLSPSDLIDGPHDLYDIEILDEDGNDYDLKNPVTVSIPADGSVANVYYLGENGETLEEVSYSVEDGYVTFEVSDFSQYAVAYNQGAAADNDDEAEDVATEDVAAGQDESADKEDEAVTAVDQDTGDGNGTSGDDAEELPNTGVAENGLLYSIATLLGALGLGSLVFSRRRKN